MAVNNFNPSVPQQSHFSSLSYTDLIQLAERQKHKIESNNVVISHKEKRLKTLRQQVQTQCKDFYIFFKY